MEEKTKLYGFYRAKVIDNKDPKMFGRVKVWIPATMPEVSDDQGLWANSANNPISGLNNNGDQEHFYSGSVLIPPKGSYVWIFFEEGNPNRPYYFSGLDLENVKVLPECQLGSEYQKKWVIFKSHEGRCIVISDDADDVRVEITGKKRQLNTPPSGDKTSVYTIDGNQTTILLDERDGKEKVLIRSHKGDYINFDVENRKLYISFDSDVHLKSNGKIFIESTEDFHIKSGAKFNVSSGTDTNIKSGGKLNSQSSDTMNMLAGADINLDGTNVMEMSGAAGPAEDATGSKPKGDR